MRLNIDPKYAIGDVVRKYKTIGKYKDKMVCPLCNGKHFADYPEYESCDGVLECPHCSEDGYIDTNYSEERVLDEEIYCVEAIYLDIRKDGSIKHTYGIQSTPELNNRTSIYVSSNASEEDLELVK